MENISIGVPEARSGLTRTWPSRPWDDVDFPVIRETRLLEVALWALVLGNALVSLEKSRFQIGSSYPLGITFSFAGMCLLYATRSWYSTATKTYGPYVCFIFTMLTLWCVVTICRADWLRITEVKQLLGGRYFAWAWVIPACMVLGSRPYAWRKTLAFMLSLASVGCLFMAIAYPLSWTSDCDLLKVCPVALLFWHDFPRAKRKILLAGAVLSILISVFASARNEVFASGLLILFAAAIQFHRRSVFRAKVRIVVMLAIVAAVGVIRYVASVDSIPFAGDYVNSRITRFKTGLLENTRAEQGGAFFPSFLEDMKLNDYLVGRGCRGMYISGSGVPRRYIECGYLQVILHGGIVMLVLILGLAIPAFYLGLFRSRNWLTRACALIVLARLLEMVPFGLPCVHMRYLLFWMAIGACLTRQMRMATDAEIASYLHPASQRTPQALVWPDGGSW